MTFEAKTNFFGNKKYKNLNCYTLLQSIHLLYFAIAKYFAILVYF